jgi:U4/U6 small nuclear ribonucleoprotein PRP31
MPQVLHEDEFRQEPPPAKLPKPLPVPDSEPKKKRGGRRLRKMKER